ncbi:protein of unknown function [Butyrivibrio sp. ob235]|uniref:ImmA/IrrE family metallo-endopeptidase n=1 Tax=Butyrivibrio sp. ob235 TaxID=1761780 RepID=UPI0008BFB233|nr:ImmA/IrrE family metallo-endopeptidase [Butyrivibrio sp. ob235]SEM26640.1 protein of unknown function [Butyrivibrio sp. ob235]
MNIERLRKIIKYSQDNRTEISTEVKKFCAYADIEPESNMLNILQIVRELFQKKGFLFLEMPIADDEIGALCYKGEGLGYVIINSSLPRVNANFALTHEIYHVFFQSDEFASKVEFADDHYYEHDDEYAANLFAGMLLMPETDFVRMFKKFFQESDSNLKPTICKLMAYYCVPYMAALIRCCELELIEKKAVTETIMNVSKDEISNELDNLWLDSMIMSPSLIDEYPLLEKVVIKLGNDYVDEQLINRRTLDKIISNMHALREKTRGGH